MFSLAWDTYVFTCPAFAEETDVSWHFGNLNFFLEKETVFEGEWGITSPKILKCDMSNFPQK